MKRRGLQLHWVHRFFLYGCVLLIFISGLIWHQVDEKALTQELSAAASTSKQVAIRFHGFSAVAFVLLLGMVLDGHVRRAWHARRNRVNGVSFLIVVSLLVLSGYSLYYVGDEQWRHFFSVGHVWIGMAFPFLLIVHVFLGRRSTLP